MRRISAIIMVSILLLAGCGGKGQSSEKSSSSLEKMSNPSAHPPKVQPIKSGNYEMTQMGKDKRRIDTIGFLEPVDPSKAVSDVNKVARDLTYVSFFSYRAKPNGDLIPLNDDGPLRATRQNNAIPMLVVTNFAAGNFSPEIAHQIFTDRTASQRLIQNVIRVMKQKGYRALNVDFEHIKEKDRQLYNGFLKTFLPQVRNEGYLVSTALAPKSSDIQAGPWHGAHDYTFHGKVADFVILMTYEWGWTGGPPMAVSPVPQIRKVLDYAISKIPKEKIIMGAPLYGYDWTLPYRKGGPPAKRVSPQAAAQLAQRMSAKVQYNNRDEAPYFYYTDHSGKKHVVWFENEQSAQAKFNLINQYGLRGISYWVLGEDFPRNWSLLQENFSIRNQR